MDLLYKSALQDLLKNPVEIPPIQDKSSPHSGFGDNPQPTLERRLWMCCDTTINDRLLLNPVRRMHLDQALGMCLWNLAADNNLANIAFFNSNASKFSDNGMDIRAAWGYRILSGGVHSRLGRSLQILASDPSSLRAVVPVFEDIDIGIPSKDIPCLLAIHFLVRGAELHAVAHLRSLNPYWVWPYDHFFLTILLELSANELSLQPGTLSYSVSSLQIAKKDEALACKALEANIPPSVAMPRIPHSGLWDLLTDLQKKTEWMRRYLTNKIGAPASELTQVLQELPDWWSEYFCALIYSYEQRHFGEIRTPGLTLPDWAKYFLQGKA